jgi:hypothetical protein
MHAGNGSSEDHRTPLLTNDARGRPRAGSDRSPKSFWTGPDRSGGARRRQFCQVGLSNCWRIIFLVLPTLDRCRVHLPDCWSTLPALIGVPGRIYRAAVMTFLYVKVWCQWQH